MGTASKPLACPKCGSAQITAHGKRYALYPAGCVMLLALPLAWLHRTSAPYDFECRSCAQRFSRRTLPARIAYGSLWLGIVLIVLWFVMKLAGF